jgi:ATP-dependent RNA helicase DeaD
VSAPPTAPPTFAGLGLRAEVLRALEEEGYERPTPIQAAAIPALLAGRDIIGQAETGTGKTAAFGLPLLQGLDPAQKGVQALVLAPTRELAIQVADALRGYGRHLGRGVRVLPVYGGQSIHLQLEPLRRGVQVVVGTPGRVKDHLERGTLDLAAVRFMCLDEADEMLAMGFIEDVEWILDHTPAGRQSALFSATLPPAIRGIAEKYLRDPVDVTISRDEPRADIEQRCLRVRSRADKDAAVLRLLEAEDEAAVLVFTATRQACDELTEHLQAAGQAVESVHGGMSQDQREAVVGRLRAGRTRVVVATDVAARGLDVDQIGLVINYDLPREREMYVHRIGRTGRAGRSGRAVTLWSPREGRRLAELERAAGRPIEPMLLPTRAELGARQRQRFEARLREVARDPALPGVFAELARGLAAEEGADLERVAAAALRLAWGDAPLEAAPAARPPREPKAPREKPAREKPARERADLREAETEPELEPVADEGQEVELYLPVGARDRLRPGDVVGAILGETGLPRQVVGKVTIRERGTFVGVPAGHAEEIIEALAATSLRGRTVRPRLAKPGESARVEAPPPRRPGPASARRPGPARGRRPRP